MSENERVFLKTSCSRGLVYSSFIFILLLCLQPFAFAQSADNAVLNGTAGVAEGVDIRLSVADYLDAYEQAALAYDDAIVTRQQAKNDFIVQEQKVSEFCVRAESVECLEARAESKHIARTFLFESVDVAVHHLEQVRYQVLATTPSAVFADAFFVAHIESISRIKRDVSSASTRDEIRSVAYALTSSWSTIQDDVLFYVTDLVYQKMLLSYEDVLLILTKSQGLLIDDDASEQELFSRARVLADELDLSLQDAKEHIDDRELLVAREILTREQSTLKELTVALQELLTLLRSHDDDLIYSLREDVVVTRADLDALEADVRLSINAAQEYIIAQLDAGNDVLVLQSYLENARARYQDALSAKESDEFVRAQQLLLEAYEDAKRAQSSS